ncbi:MAG TPA: DinB family protein [Chitinophagales bacterium]|nr:DinB family protein [Chitinophagales bacterium]
MYTTLQHFLNEWKYESEGTLKLFSLLTDEALNKKVHERVRTAGFLAWHITHTVKEMMEKAGLKIDGKEQTDYNGETVKEICDTYKQSSDSLVAQLANWTDADLETETEMYGEKWKRGVTLGILIKHQAHHRGQLEIIMRLCDLKVTGVYGPAYEEWAQWGMEPMK